MNLRQLGILGEEIALNYLKNKGYQILDKNYSFRIPGNPQKGEIDIIAKKGDTIAFTEVKTLYSRNYPTTPTTTDRISPEEKVSFSKQRKLIRAAESWLMKNKIPLESKWQMDIIALELKSGQKKAEIRHFQNAFSA